MARWIDLCGTEEVSAGEKKVVTAETKSLVLCRVDDKLHAVENVCPHAGMPIGTGDLNGCILTCPFHGFAYDITTGKNIDFADDVPLSRLPVRETDGGRIEIDLDMD